jgi:hypothetical protein
LGEGPILGKALPGKKSQAGGARMDFRIFDIYSGGREKENGDE